MVKPLTFKGDKPKKRKHRSTTTTSTTYDDNDDTTTPRSKQLKSDRRTTPAENEKGELEIEEDQSWVSADIPSDISGPILLVLPTTGTGTGTGTDTTESGPGPTCIATDANGSVFASPLENLIEGDPATAEPHDVRQVWVANRVAGTEGFSFKGFCGKYLSVDKYGILSATSAAVSYHESFLVLPAPDMPSCFLIQTMGGDRETFLSVKEGVPSKKNVSGSQVEIRGDETTTGFSTTMRIRMQAKFKPRIKANKETKAREKVSRKELESAVGRPLEDHEVKRLRKARKEGNFHEEVLDVRVKGKHDKFA